MDKKGRVVGIDLGTSTSEIAILENGNPKLIKNHLGSFITPSVIRFLENGEIIIGESAKECLITDPENTFYEFKRTMGTDTIYESYGKKYSSVDLSAILLKYLIKCVSDEIGETVSSAVITVPAYFSDKQRKETVKAGEQAGIEVMRIINEPTSAALDYGLNNMTEIKNILVYDLGGGTLDVTLLEFFEGIIDVKASCGNNKLGGKDFDQCIIDYLMQCIYFKTKEKTTDLRGLSRLKVAAEEAKIALSTQQKYEIVLPFFGTVKDKPYAVDEVITADTYNGLISPLVYSTKQQIDTVLNDAGLNKEDIDLVLLVGGSTKTPLVEKFIKDTLNKEPVKLIDPDLAVVKGAAIQAGIINDELEEGLIITDVCPFTLGTSVLDYDGDNMFFAGLLGNNIFDPIIKRNSTIPITKKKTYVTASNFQSSVKVDVYQGEFEDLEKNTFLGEFKLSGIPPAPAGHEKLEIAFSYDLNGILNAEATILSNKKSANITIITTKADTEDIEDIKNWVNGENASKYKTLIKRVENMVNKTSDTELSDTLNQLKIAIAQNKPEEELEDLKDIITDILADLRSEL